MTLTVISTELQQVDAATNTCKAYRIHSSSKGVVARWGRIGGRWMTKDYTQIANNKGRSFVVQARELEAMKKRDGYTEVHHALYAVPDHYWAPANIRELNAEWERILVKDGASRGIPDFAQPAVDKAIAELMAIFLGGD